MTAEQLVADLLEANGNITDAANACTKFLNSSRFMKPDMVDMIIEARDILLSM